MGSPAGERMKDIYTGSLTRLAAFDFEEMSKAYAVWNRDSELKRLLDAEAARLHSVKAGEKFFEEMVKNDGPEHHFFSIRALEDNRLLGDLNLDVINNWASRDAFVGINVGNREDWGKGYGTDAMQTALRFAFTELNLRRVTLNVFEYNPRAIRSYEKAGFKIEGRQRQIIFKNGKRYDMIFMGVLRDEWIQSNTAAPVSKHQ
jgi:RimJ/RimL family protein N-acetyltransferase